MYEQFRIEFADKLVTKGIQNISDILNALDSVANKYELSLKETQLAPYISELPDTVKMYLVVRKMQGFSEKTLDSYKLLLENFFFTVGKLPNNITSADIRMWLFNYQANRNISMRSLDHYRATLAAFFNWAFNEGYLDTNPAKNVTEIKFEVKQREALSQLELEELRTACRTLRETAILEFLYSTGCRVSELTNVKLSDVNWDDKSVTLFGKGAKYRTSFINAKCEFTLKEYLASRKDNSPYLFVKEISPFNELKKASIEKMFKELSIIAFGENGKRVSPHIIRHTTATVALQRGMPITDIQKLLGHSNVNTTMVYAKTTNEDVQYNHNKFIT